MACELNKVYRLYYVRFDEYAKDKIELLNMRTDLLSVR